MTCIVVDAAGKEGFPFGKDSRSVLALDTGVYGTAASAGGKDSPTPILAASWKFDSGGDWRNCRNEAGERLVARDRIRVHFLGRLLLYDQELSQRTVSATVSDGDINPATGSSESTILSWRGEKCYFGAQNSKHEWYPMGNNVLEGSTETFQIF
jgi:hypothetical protein